MFNKNHNYLQQKYIYILFFEQYLDITMTFEDIKIPGELIIVNGEKSEKDIFVFTLSTCQWCRKGKQWLTDNKYAYKYIDVDLLPIAEKRTLEH